MKLAIPILLTLTILSNCSRFRTADKFDKDVWQANNNVKNQSNPRADMTDDLLKNYLKVGMQKNLILDLLGEPLEEKIENRLPKGLKVPDSLSLTDSVNFKKENQDKASKNFNDWFKTNSQPNTLLLYPIGWSTIDPKFLVIKLKPDNTASEFWIEQK